MNENRIIHRIPIILFILLLGIVIGEHNILKKCEENLLTADFQKSDAFRRQKYDDKMIEYLKTESKSVSRDAGLYLLETRFGEDTFTRNYSKNTFDELEQSLKKKNNAKQFMDTCIQIWGEVKCFPVPVSSDNKNATVSYSDSWLYDRNYKMHNAHEGTDIMANINQRGYYPIVSMTDGVVTNLGWLELGGYRVGITTKTGTYFYYAHLSNYANIKEGMEVKAGDLLGFMGDSGYGAEEGTVGKFPVHLHLGIYLYPDGEETSVNPYAVLRYSEKHKLSCTYH